ncbi:flagellin C-terminal helical region [Methylobacterium sp. 174MFSha1.1]|uniref:flagellin n=1 Tax=Methylobacterium sp. 174MFSha1.1 TaxID=1502749 RepID=UPI0008F44098|nr:flagellin [Methylobacterium sp. 174MFSha1.1]SFU53722.1 flagellin C-terminal helical region [Methylobacterium sp. 174MFSha1.1]
MTIAPFAAGTAAADLNTQRLVAMKTTLGTLSNQIGSGRTAETYGGLGTGRTQSLSAHAQISALDGYIVAAGTGATRVALASASVQQIATLGSSAWNSLVSARTGAGTTARSTLQQDAAGNLGGALDALNQSTGGQYILGGRVTDRAPVETASRILDGDPASGLDGVRTVIAERQAADLGAGTPKTGRLDLSGTGASMSLSESQSPGVRANFGFTIARAVSSNPAGLAVAFQAGAPAAATLSFASQPKDGDIVRVSVQNTDGSQGFVDLTARAAGSGGDGTFTIGADAAASAQNLTAALGGKTVTGVQSANPPGASAALSGGIPASATVTVGAGLQAGDSVQITVGLRDGTSQTISLTASADGKATGSFAIGASADDTATNLKAALATALDASAGTDLAASSATRAASDFFAGSSSPGLSPRRVATDASGNATGYVADPSGRTLIWYKGDDTSADPRRTATVPVSGDRSVAIGVQANESAFRGTLSGLAVLATTPFDETDTDNARFDAYSGRVQTLLKPADGQPSVQGIASELSLASAQIDTQTTQNKATKAVLQKTVDGVESVSTEEAATKLLSLQTQLQASYQATSMLSKLTLTSYL